MQGPDAIVGLAFFACVSIVVTNIARVIGNRRGAGSQRELNAMRDELDQLRAELESMHGRLEQVDELQNRVDFAERMLGQIKSGGALPGGRG
jgi:uncharacterized protein involved in exopolysaccharide biosynthesis